MQKVATQVLCSHSKIYTRIAIISSYVMSDDKCNIFAVGGLLNIIFFIETPV